MERLTIDDVASPGGNPPREVPREARLREVSGILREVTGEDAAWADRITEATRLDDDLWLESVELAVLGERMRQRYGDGVDLPAFLAGCDIDQLIALTVGDLVELVTGNGSGLVTGSGRA